MMSDEIKMKRCSRGEKCVNPEGCLQPATNEFFRADARNKDGLRSNCRSCDRAYRKGYYAANREKLLESGRNYRAEHRERLRELHREWRTTYPDKANASKRKWKEANPERTKETQRAWKMANPDKVKQHRRRHYEIHGDKLRDQSRQYRADNPDKVRESQKRYRAENKERLRERDRKYRETHQERIRSSHSKWRAVNGERIRRVNRANLVRYRARKKKLPNTFTAADWQRAINYFNGCCAVCGRPLNDLFGTHAAAADHWIALSDPRPDNPGTVPTNIIPLCHGEGGCNNSKSNRPAEEWLIERFGKRRARDILRRIDTYFQWVKEQDERGA